MQTFLGWSKELWIKFGVVTGLFLSLPLLAYWKGFSVNNALILATGLVLLLYTIETQGMRLEMVRQNEIAIQPLLVAGVVRRDGRPRVVLRNVGKGTALFVRPKDVVFPGEGDIVVRATFEGVDYIGPDGEAIVQTRIFIEAPNEEPLEGGTDDPFAYHLHPDDAPRTYEVVIAYEDISGGQRESVMRMGRDGIRLLGHGKA